MTELASRPNDVQPPETTSAFTDLRDVDRQEEPVLRFFHKALLTTPRVACNYI